MVNKREYKHFMSLTRREMRDDIIGRMLSLGDEFYMSDEDMDEMEKLSQNITALGTQFYGRAFSLSERRKFIDMYRR